MLPLALGVVGVLMIECAGRRAARKLGVFLIVSCFAWLILFFVKTDFGSCTLMIGKDGQAHYDIKPKTFFGRTVRETDIRECVVIAPEGAVQ